LPHSLGQSSDTLGSTRLTIAAVSGYQYAPTESVLNQYAQRFDIQNDKLR